MRVWVHACMGTYVYIRCECLSSVCARPLVHAWYVSESIHRVWYACMYTCVCVRKWTHESIYPVRVCIHMHVCMYGPCGTKILNFLQCCRRSVLRHVTLFLAVAPSRRAIVALDNFPDFDYALRKGSRTATTNIPHILGAGKK